MRPTGLQVLVPAASASLGTLCPLRVFSYDTIAIGADLCICWLNTCEFVG